MLPDELTRETHFESRIIRELLQPLSDCPWAYCVGSSLNSLFVCLLSVRLSVVCPDKFWTKNPPKAPGGVPVRVQNQTRFDHFAESTQVWDSSNVPPVYL